MAKINLTLPYGEVAVTGKQVTFKAPCGSGVATAITIDGIDYALVDSAGKELVPNAFETGAMVSVILNTPTLQAFIQNPNTTEHIEEQLKSALYPTFAQAKELDYIHSGENLSSIMGKISRLIMDYITGADRAQLKPEFANDVSECTDTSKLYVLPDGYIYAAFAKTSSTNLITESIDTDYSLYNGGQGWKQDIAVDVVGDLYAEGAVSTGYIPGYVGSLAFNISEMTLNPTKGTYCNYIVYKQDFTPIARFSLKNDLGLIYEHDKTGCITWVDLDTAEIWKVLVTDDGEPLYPEGTPIYVRFTADRIDSDSIITSQGSSYIWRSTGHKIGGEDGEDGADGKDGGYYIPKVSQPTLGLMQVAFTPSKDSMEEFEEVLIQLPQGLQGIQGIEGKSAYAIAVASGFEGTEAEWLESLKGDTPIFKVGKLSNRFFLRTTNSGETETTYFVIPYVTLSETEGGYTLTITDDKGEHTAFLQHGAQGPQGIQGERGEPFSIAKVYESEEAMRNDFGTDSVKEGQFVLIDTGNVEDEENARLYIKGTASFNFVTDLSGATGMQGPQGIQGIQGVQGLPGYTPQRGIDYWTEADKNEIKAEAKTYVDEAILGGAW